MADNFLDLLGLTRFKSKIDELLNGKQDTLVSGTNIKTINNTSLLGSGNIDIQGGSSEVVHITTIGESASTYAETQAACGSGKIVLIDNEYIATDCVDSDSYIEITALKPYDGCIYMRVYSINPDNIWTTYTEVPMASYIDIPGQARETVSGTVKTNPIQNIDLDENGRLIVGGRIGQFEGTTGLFAPNDRQPRQVSNYSFLVTDALGMSIGNRALAVVSGYGLACKSAAAGSTEYRITNNYNNRIIAKMAEGGFASRDEATSKVEQIIPVVSVTINGSAFTPDSAANSSNDIVIKTEETLNPDTAITNIRLFGVMGSYATVHTGNGIKSESGGRNLLLGGGVTKAGSGNDNCIVGNGMYSSGNGNAMFGRFHIARKNRGLLAGTGHDSTNAPSEGASAVGQYSYMDASTLFAVGNGSSHTERSNAFEVRSDGVVFKSPNGTRYKLAVDNSGNLTTNAI